jgi:hypothetical protein
MSEPRPVWVLLAVSFAAMLARAVVLTNGKHSRPGSALELLLSCHA